MAYEYEVNVFWQGGRRTLAQSPEIPEDITVSTPSQFPGGEKDIWSPEHLFTAAVSSCYMTTFLALAEKARLQLVNFQVASKGTIRQTEDGLAITEVLLEPVITLSDEKETDKAERTALKAHALCLVTNSIKAKVTLMCSIEVKSKAAQLA
ncbi:MAG: OsmC family protein [Chitinophagales bacterium]